MALTITGVLIVLAVIGLVKIYMIERHMIEEFVEICDETMRLEIIVAAPTITVENWLTCQRAVLKDRVGLVPIGPTLNLT